MALDLVVKIGRLDIIKKLIAHRANHVREYQEAMEVYKKDKLARLCKALESMETAILNTEKFDDPRIEPNMGLQVPIDNSSKYDEMIQTLEMGTDDLIEVSYEDAKNIASNAFTWLDSAKFVNAMYSSRR